MDAFDCAYPGCRGFSMSQCARCDQRYCQQHKALLANLCLTCQASERQHSPQHIRTGLLLMFVPISLYVLLSSLFHLGALNLVQFSLPWIGLVVGLLGCCIVGSILFLYGWLTRG